MGAVDGSSSSFVYLKNATDKPQQYHLEIDFDNGVYSLGLKTIEPDQPITFDLRALRDKQVPDVKGRKIPLKAASGQVHWSIDGDEHVGLIGRVEQVDMVKGISMTAACAECCPDSWYSFWIDPLGGTALPGDTSQFVAMQQNITCYGEVLDPFQRFPGNFTSDNPSVANCDSSGFTTAFTPGTANLGAHWTVVSWDFDPIGSGGCTRYLENANPEGICDVAGIRGYVTNPPIDNDGDAIIAGQQFTLTAEIVKPSGDRATSFSGDATFSMAGGSITGENLPTGISISNGIGTVQMTLKAVKNTGEAGRSYHLTFNNGALTGITNFGGFFNIYFNVMMDVERWKNCGFVDCPNLGSYFCTRGCNPFSGFESPTSFISLTDSSACGAGVRVVNSETGAFGGTNVSDLGPTTNNKYWLTGNMPDMGGCLSDNLANLIGVDNGCNPNHGEGFVHWRFIPQ